MTKKRTKSKTSNTAIMTCVSRAGSYFEKNFFYKSDDYIATKLVPLYVKFFLKIKFIRNLFLKKIAPKGIYEYVIARTKYIDEIFTKALAEGFDQILIFGAGFDTRGIRYLTPKNKSIVFELDLPITQKAKLKQLKKRGITIPSNIVFISIDFNKESLSTKLDYAGFKKNKKSLFILEGLIMYLDESAVEDTFKLIKEYASKESLLVFDTIYASVLREEHHFYGEKEIYKTVRNAGEKWTFGIDQNEIQSFLEKRNYQLVEKLDSKALEKKYFTNEKSQFVKNIINGTHCVVLAKII